MKATKRTGFNGIGYEIIFYQERRSINGQTKIFTAKPVVFEFEEYTDEKVLEPTFILPYEEMFEFIPSIQKLGDETGIPSETESSAKSELKATKYHLEDIRKLLFKEDK